MTMLIPSYDKLYQRSTIIRKAHRTRRKQLLRELRRYIGKKYQSPLDPIPCRLPKYPSYQDMLEYW